MFMTTVAYALERVILTLLDIDISAVKHNGHFIYTTEEFFSHSGHMGLEDIPAVLGHPQMSRNQLFGEGSPGFFD
jgi:hypothetical protein